MGSVRFSPLLEMDEEARRVRDSGADYASLPQESIPDSEELGVVEPDEVPPEDNRTMLLCTCNLLLVMELTAQSVRSATTS